MSKTQSRRGVSLSASAYAALVAHAARENITLSELVTRGLRLAGVDIPEQTHRTRAEAEHAVARRIDARHASVIARPKPLRLARGHAPKRNAVPTADDLAALLQQCRRGVPNINHGERTQREAAKRRVSLRFSHELRKRGWLAEEGYAEGSWAAPVTKRKAA